MMIRLASKVQKDSIVDGPGLRTVIWTQGCKHACPGCHNPQTHDVNGGFEMKVDDIIEEIRNSHLQKGITLSGGEPFLQPIPLARIAKEAQSLGMDVWCYTGFRYEWLIDERNPLFKENMDLLHYIDVLVDGKFVLAKKDYRLKFRGSSNQRIIDVKKSLSEDSICLHPYNEI